MSSTNVVAIGWAGGDDLASLQQLANYTKQRALLTSHEAWKARKQLQETNHRIEESRALLTKGFTALFTVESSAPARSD